jgi:uncharacterized protein YdaU (DUF1376 family)
MSSSPAPAFQFYPNDWRGSRRVQAMSFKERGMYFEMLIEQWDKGSVPASMADLARLLGGTEGDWTRAWPKLSACFTTRARDGRLVNAKLETVRRAREKFRKAQAASGLRGAEARWKEHGKPMGSPSKPNGVGMTDDGSSSSPSSFSSTSSPVRTAALTRVNRDGGLAGFEAFWAEYPKKVGKDDARRA